MVVDLIRQKINEFRKCDVICKGEKDCIAFLNEITGHYRWNAGQSPREYHHVYNNITQYSFSYSSTYSSDKDDIRFSVSRLNRIIDDEKTIIYNKLNNELNYSIW